jgi:hypothetical protein
VAGQGNPVAVPGFGDFQDFLRRIAERQSCFSRKAIGASGRILK